jgi:hypothetical protein
MPQMAGTVEADQSIACVESLLSSEFGFPLSGKAMVGHRRGASGGALYEVSLIEDKAKDRQRVVARKGLVEFWVAIQPAMLVVAGSYELFSGSLRVLGRPLDLDD